MAVRSGRELVREYQERLTDRIMWDGTWGAIGAMLSPHESEIQSKAFQGARQTEHMYDSTGPDAWDKLTSAMMGTMFSPVVPWYTFRPRAAVIRLDPEVLDWLDLVSTDTFDTINASNFDRVAPGMISSVSGFGTGAMGVVEVDPLQAQGVSGFRGLHHMALPIGTYVIDEDGWGNVDTLIRSVWMSVSAMLGRWPDAVFSPETRQTFKDHPTSRVQVVHGVTPNGRTRGARWDSWYVYLGLDTVLVPALLMNNGDGVVELEQGTFRDFPFMVPRWYQSSGEVYGRGRGHLAYPEMRTANRARQLKLRAWAKTIDPPLKVLSRGVFGKVRLLPGAENVVRDMNAIEAMDFKIRFDHNAIPESESKLQIRQMFFTEQLLQFAVDRKTPPTATEVLQRMDFLHQLLGPASGRIRVEAQTPYVKRVFQLKLRAGEFPPPPNALLAAGGVIDIEYLGPLARAQHNDELRGLTDTVAIVGSLAELDPNVPDNYDFDVAARDLPRITGVSRQYLRAIDARDELRTARQEQAAALEQQQEAQAIGATAKDLGAGMASEAQAVAAQGGPV